MTQPESKFHTTSIKAAFTSLIIGVIGFGGACVLLGNGLACDEMSQAAPWILGAILLSVVTGFALRLIDTEQAVIRYERQSSAQAEYETKIAQAAPKQTHIERDTFAADVQRPRQLPEPMRLVSVGNNQLRAVTPTDDERIDQLAQAIVTRCASVNPSQTNIEARIPMRPDGILRSHSDITMALQKLAAMGWVGKTGNSKTARWLWCEYQGGQKLVDFDRTPTSLSE